MTTLRHRSQATDGAHDSLYFDRLGDDFDRWMSDYDVSRRIVLIQGMASTLVGGLQGKRVLEIGAGTGRISRALKERGACLTVNDVSSRLVEKVSVEVGCAGLPGDCCAMPCADSAFDVVVSSECIEHTADPYEAIAEMYRVLRPGGMLILTTPNKLWYPVLLVARKLRLRKFSGPECWTWPHETRRRLEALGFRNVVLSGCHLFPWQLPLARIVLPYLDRLGCILYPIMINYCARATKQ